MFGSRDLIFNIPSLDKNPLFIHGKGVKGLVIICSKEHFGDAERGTLERMMGAIKYDFNQDVRVYVLESDQKMTLDDIDIDYQHVLLFGIAPVRVGMQVELFINAILPFDHQKFLFSENLSMITTDKDKKMALWNKLQILFLQQSQ
jgi:hypothetical protein